MNKARRTQLASVAPLSLHPSFLFSQKSSVDVATLAPGDRAKWRSARAAPFCWRTADEGFKIASLPQSGQPPNRDELRTKLRDASSSDRTLAIMLVVAAVGMLMVVTYTTIVYWTFRRRVEIEPPSY
jgi:hypothetical protein